MADTTVRPADYRKLTQPERAQLRAEYVGAQGGNCCHCKASLDGEPAEKTRRLSVNSKLFPANFFKWPIHLHHCHRTGMTIGAVHAHCNAVLWQYHGE